MATKKKAYSKKKSTVKKKTTTKKPTAKKTSTAKKPSSTRKTTSTVKKTSVKKPAAKKTSTKSSTVKRSNTKSTTSKKTSPKTVENKPKLKINEEELEEITKVDLPKLKDLPKKEINNQNEPTRVIKTEDFTVIKKEPIRLKKEVKLPDEQVSKKKKKHLKSKAKKIDKTKKSSFKKSLNKIKRKIKIYGLSSVIPIKYIVLIILFIGLLVASPYIYRFITNQPIILNIESIPDKIDHLEIVSFNMNDVDEIISSLEEEKVLVNLASYYEYHFENVFHLNPSYVKEYALKYNDNSKQLFFVLKATDNNEENVKNVFDSFLREKGISPDSYEYMEYQGYQIYINSGSKDKNTIVKSKIMQSKKEVFSYLKSLTKEEIEQTFKIAPSLYKEELVKTAMVIKSDTCQYVIFKPVDKEAKEEIKSRMDDYYESLEIKWANNTDNVNLVKNRLFEEYQGYLIYIISYDNKLVMDLIKSNK